MSDNILLSWPQSIGLLLLLPALPAALALCFFLVKKSASRRNNTAPDWSIPFLQEDQAIRSMFHSWDPRFKLAILFIFCLVITSLSNLGSVLLALAISIGATLLCRAPLKRVVARMAAISGFLSMFLVILPFTATEQPGETLLILPFAPGLPFHTSGLLLAFTIIVKACSIALLMEPMVGTATLTTTLEALQRLGIPPALTQIVMVTYRYGFICIEECRRMYLAMKVRGFTPGTDLNTIRVMGNFFGILFIRAYMRTRHVYEAMLSRGYTGKMPVNANFQAGTGDYFMAAIWLATAFTLVLLDRSPTLG